MRIRASLRSRGVLAVTEAHPAVGIANEHFRIHALEGRLLPRIARSGATVVKIQIRVGSPQVSFGSHHFVPLHFGLVQQVSWMGATRMKAQSLYVMESSCSQGEKP